MHLARGVLNPRSREVARDLRDPYELHRTVMRLFPDGQGEAARRAHGALHRLDFGTKGQAMLVIQSATAPDLSKLPERYWDDGDFYDYPRVDQLSVDAIATGQVMLFRLRANVTKREKESGRRVALRLETEHISWLARRAEAAGFETIGPTLRLHVERDSRTRLSSERSEAPRASFGCVRFEGALVVRDVERFKAALRDGIGPGKAFGCGLLSVVSAGNVQRPHHEPPTAAAAPKNSKAPTTAPKWLQNAEEYLGAPKSRKR